MLLPTLKRAFGIFGLFIFLLVLFLPGYTKLQELRDRNTDLEVKIKRLNMENALLQEEIHRLETDPLYQEKMLREKMGIVRKGEIPIRVAPKKQQR